MTGQNFVTPKEPLNCILFWITTDIFLPSQSLPTGSVLIKLYLKKQNLNKKEDSMFDLSLEAGGIRFKNPVVASSGSITLTMKHMKKCIEAGVGAITTKCISTEALTWGVFRPRHTFLDKFGYPGSLHSIELAFRTPEEGEEDIKQIKHLAEENDVRIISNITATGLDRESWQRLAILSQEAGADMVEILLVCPHGGDLTAVAEGKVGRFLGMDPEIIFSIVKMVKDVVDIPVIAKIGPST